MITGNNRKKMKGQNTYLAVIVFIVLAFIIILFIYYNYNLIQALFQKGFTGGFS